jgi:hypothetical protein
MENTKSYQIIIAILVVVILVLLYHIHSSMTSPTTTTTSPTTATSTTTMALRQNLLGGTEYVPSSLQILEYCADSIGNDISPSVSGLNLDGAVAQMPSGAVGFVFAPDSLPVTSTSTGQVYYKSQFGISPDPTVAVFQKINGVWKYDNYNHVTDDIYDRDGTIQDAMNYSDGITLSQGFVFTATDTSQPLTLTTPGHFFIKDHVGPFVYYNKRSYLIYAKQSYILPVGTFTKSL